MTARSPWIVRAACAGLAVTFLLLAPTLHADNVTGSMRRAAEEFLAAVASGDPQAVAYAIHPAELEELRKEILELLRQEARRGESLIRGRLFGPGMPLADIERMTSINFYAHLGRRLRLTGRQYSRIRGIEALPAPGDRRYLVVEGEQPKDRGEVRVVELVTVRPYGKDWKAAIPSEIRAQIEDLIAGRGPARAASARPAGASGPAAPSSRPSGGASSTTATPRAIVDLLNAAEKTLSEGNCAQYYNEYMSPNFRRVTSKKALEDLISACQNSLGTREMLLATLRIVRDSEPRLEYEGQRAVYDLSGQGLPYDRFALEQVDKRWYIAE